MNKIQSIIQLQELSILLSHSSSLLLLVRSSFLDFLKVFLHCFSLIFSHVSNLFPRILYLKYKFLLWYQSMKLYSFKNGKKETINPYDKEVTAHSMTQIDHSIVNFQNHITTIKPDKYNFLVCKRKIIKILYSLDLEQYLTSVGPPIILQNGEVNPSYKI